MQLQTLYSLQAYLFKSITTESFVCWNTLLLETTMPTW